jgi:hypothetical protein
MELIGNCIHPRRHGIHVNTTKLLYLTIGFGSWKVGAVKIVQMYGFLRTENIGKSYKLLGLLGMLQASTSTKIPSGLLVETIWPATYGDLKKIKKTSAFPKIL